MSLILLTVVTLTLVSIYAIITCVYLTLGNLRELKGDEWDV